MVRAAIYRNATRYFVDQVNQGRFLVIDSGLSMEAIRRDLKQNIPGLRIIHIQCPLWLAIMRDTVRSLRRASHPRGRFLHLRALNDLLNPFRRDKFFQPGITDPFEYPACADGHVSTFRKHPIRVAQEILEKVHINVGTPLGDHLKTGHP